MKKGYVAFNLSDAAHAMLLDRHPAKFPMIVAHHVTFAFGVDESFELPQDAEVKVVGYACDDKIECVVVEVNGSTQRPSDGKLFHITISHTKDAKPVQSNDLLRDQGYESVENFFLETIPTFNSF